MKVCESPQSDVSNCLLIAVEDILRIPCELLLGKQYELYSYWIGDVYCKCNVSVKENFT